MCRVPLRSLDHLARLEAASTYQYSFGLPVDQGADGLKVGHKSALRDSRNASPNAAFDLREAAPLHLSPGCRMFPADFTYPGHGRTPLFGF